MLKVDSKLAAFLAHARSAWPGVHLHDEEMLAYVRDRWSLDAGPLDAIAWDDLYLACACSKGDPTAHALFETRILGAITRHVKHINAAKEFADEVRQRLLERLLAGPAPKIVEYTGSGPIGGWVRVGAIRMALNVRRETMRAGRRDHDFFEQGALAPAADPEIEFLRVRYASEAKDAFAYVVGSLPVDERAVLRMHYLNGLTFEEVGVAYGVHRATAARWIAAARERILEELRRRLQERLGATPAELDSVIALVQSGLDVSLRRLLEGSQPKLNRSRE